MQHLRDQPISPVVPVENSKPAVSEIVTIRFYYVWNGYIDHSYTFSTGSSAGIAYSLTLILKV
jgi:hypothetical protein